MNWQLLKHRHFTNNGHLVQRVFAIYLSGACPANNFGSRDGPFSLAMGRLRRLGASCAKPPVLLVQRDRSRRENP